jgi:hypothetical protein
MADDYPPNATLSRLCWLIGSTPAIQRERYYNPLFSVLNTIISLLLVQVITVLLYGYGSPSASSVEDLHVQMRVSLCVILISLACTGTCIGR